MSGGLVLIYLEADDEITTVVRRLREAGGHRVVIVAPGRSRATSSVVALRLLARAAEAGGQRVAVVGDALTRSLASEAGLATYASVDDARSADPDAPVEPVEAHSAYINVVRGKAVDDTAPTLAGVATSQTSPAAERDAETRVVPVARPAAAPRSRRRRTAGAPGRAPGTGRRRISTRVGFAALAAVLVGWAAIAALILPAAAITIEPRTEPVGPVSDVVVIDTPERISGSVEAAVTATPTVPFDVEEAATGTVVFFNWSFLSVDVPAGSLVAAGKQAFETLEPITVPNGEFDPFQGGITAGEAGVGVRAAAPGPDANVAADAIDTVLDPTLDSQLRGFPSITERRVTNPEATSGGVIESGLEFGQEDVDAAVADLRDSLAAAVEAELAGTEDLVFVDPADPLEPQITGLDDLVGRRDAEQVELTGSLAYDRLAADPDDVTARAIDQFAADPALPDDGWTLIESATVVEIGEARREGDRLLVDVTVNGVAAPVVERDAVIDRVTGLSAEEARAALAELGVATVELWPGWVGTVPESDWRIDVELLAPTPPAEP